MDFTENKDPERQNLLPAPSSLTAGGIRCFVLQWTPVLFRDKYPHPLFWDVRIEENFEKHLVWVCAAMTMQTWKRLRDSLGWDAQEVKQRLRDHLLDRMPLGIGWDVQIIVADPPNE